MAARKKPVTPVIALNPEQPQPVYVLSRMRAKLPPRRQVFTELTGEELQVQQHLDRLAYAAEHNINPELVQVTPS